MKKTRLEKIKDSKAYQTSQRNAEKIIANKDKLQTLLLDTQKKLSRSTKAKSQNMAALLTDALALLKAYVTGQYKQLPVNSLMMLVAALLYFVMPLDFIPDFLFGLGLIDDFAILAWTLNAIKQDIDDFKQWRDVSVERDKASENNNEENSDEKGE